MGESKHIREIIERVVSASLATHDTALKGELVDKACRIGARTNRRGGSFIQQVSDYEVPLKFEESPVVQRIA